MASAAGTITIDTAVDTKGIETSGEKIKVGLSSVQKKAKEAGEATARAYEETARSAGKAVDDILRDAERSAKSKAASIAAIYRKEGYSQEEAFKKAWSQIERSSSSGSQKVKRHLHDISEKSKKVSDDMLSNLSRGLKGIVGTVKKIGKILVAAFAIREIVGFGQECLELGSDLAEVQNVVDVTFSSMSGKVDEFARSAVRTYGLSETMAKQYTGTFGAMAKAFGFTEQQAYDMGTSLTGLTGDVASFYNLTQDEAYTKLKSVFTGETESLKDLGVVMTQAALDQYALANGYGKTTAAMTEQEKVALRFAFVQDQLSLASGDFIRTSSSWANQVRVMQLQIQSLKATIGQGLINLFTPVIKVINILLEKLATVANAFKAFTELLTGGKSTGATSIQSAGAGLSDLESGYNAAAGGAENLAGSTRNAADATGDQEKATKKATKAAVKYLSPLDEINKYTEKDKSAGASSGTPLAGSAGGAISGAAVDFGGLAEGSTVIDEVDSKFTKLFENIRRLCEPATESLKRLWNEGLSRLGGFVFTGLKDFYKSFLVPVGTWTLGTGIPRFVDALNNGLMKVNFQMLNGSLRRLWDALAPFAIHIGEGLLWFWENVLVPLGTWTSNEVVPRFLDSLRIASGWLNVILTDLQPLFQWFWGSVLQPLAQWTGGVFLEIWDKINGLLQRFSDWCKENPKAVQTMAVVIGSFFAAFKVTSLISGLAGMIKKIDGVVGIVKKLGTLINGVLNPWALALGAIIVVGIEVWKNWDVIKAKAIQIWGAIKEWFDDTTAAIKSYFSRLWESIETTFANVGAWFTEKFNLAWSGIKTAFSTAGTFFGDVWRKIKDAFGNIAEWFEGKFSAAWEAVKAVFSSGGKVFSGIKDGILRGLKAVINKLISGINRVITIPFDGINNALNGIRNTRIFDWYPFSGIPTISTPQIPYLASGAVIPPRAEFLAVLGDQKNGRNLEAPESLLRKIVREESGQGGGNYRFTAVLNRRTIFDEMIEEAKLRQEISGNNPFELA